MLGATTRRVVTLGPGKRVMEIIIIRGGGGHNIKSKAACKQRKSAIARHQNRSKNLRSLLRTNPHRRTTKVRANRLRTNRRPPKLSGMCQLDTRSKKRLGPEVTAWFVKLTTPSSGVMLRSKRSNVEEIARYRSGSCRKANPCSKPNAGFLFRQGKKRNLE